MCVQISDVHNRYSLHVRAQGQYGQVLFCERRTDEIVITCHHGGCTPLLGAFLDRCKGSMHFSAQALFTSYAKAFTLQLRFCTSTGHKSYLLTLLFFIAKPFFMARPVLGGHKLLHPKIICPCVHNAYNTGINHCLPLVAPPRFGAFTRENN